MMKFSSRRKRVTVLVAAAAAVAVGGGLAYAYWTSTGTGSGTATTGSSTAFVVTTGGAAGGPLAPGGASETVGYTVTNPLAAAGNQKVTSVVVTVANADGSDWTSVNGCSSDDYTVSTPTFTAVDLVPGGTKTGTVTVTMNNLTTNQDACQGHDVPLYLVAS